jgi:hypothetical protein
MGALIAMTQHTWAVILLVTVPVGAVVGFLVNVATLRRAARERNKLDLEIAKLKEDASNRDVLKVKLELEIKKLKDEADHQARVDEKAARLVQSADLIQMHRALERQLEQRSLDGRRYDFLPRGDGGGYFVAVNVRSEIRGRNGKGILKPGVYIAAQEGTRLRFPIVGDGPGDSKWFEIDLREFAKDYGTPKSQISVG